MSLEAYVQIAVILGVFITGMGTLITGMIFLRSSLRDIRGEIKDVRTEIKDVRTELKDGLEAVHTRIEAVHTRIDGVHTKIDGVQQQVAGQGERWARIEGMLTPPNGRYLCAGRGSFCGAKPNASATCSAIRGSATRVRDGACVRFDRRRSCVLAERNVNLAEVFNFLLRGICKPRRFGV